MTTFGTALFSIAFLCFILHAFSQSCDPACTTNTSSCVFGSDSNALCSCFSGYEGSICNETVAPTCLGSFGNLSNLITDFPPVIDSAASGISGGVFTLVINGPLVSGREITKIYISNNTNNPVCSYPGPNWQKTLDNTNCSDSFTATIDWTDVVQCGWDVNNETTGLTIYTTNIFVEHRDYIDDFRGTTIYRTTEHIVPIQLNLDTQITVSTLITVFAPVNLQAAVTMQTFNPDTQVGVLEITTSLQWPFEITDIGLASFPTEGNLSANIAEITSGTCTNVTDSVCLQVFRISINPDVACSLSGGYNVTFNTNCRNETTCPLEGPTPSSMFADVNSENFCVAVEVDIGLGGTLTSYQDTVTPYTIPRDDYFLDAVAVFRADLFSDTGIELSSTTIVNVEVKWEENQDSTFNNSVFLYSNGVTTAEGTTTSLSILEESTNFAAFSFTPEVSVTPVEVDQYVSFTVFCTLNVTFEGSPSKRFEVFRMEHPTQGKIVSIMRQTETGSDVVYGSRSLNTAAQFVLSRESIEDETDPNIENTASSITPYWMQMI